MKKRGIQNSIIERIAANQQRGAAFIKSVRGFWSGLPSADFGALRHVFWASGFLGTVCYQVL
jgi:hypothetical protein